jgi:uncharacterized protein DUF29
MSRTTNASLYEEDFYEWSLRTAELVRQGRWQELDPESVAEEIESLGRSDKRQIRNRLEVLIMHLLKWSVQTERRCGSWKATIIEQRFRLDGILKDSPSLRARLEEFVGDAYPGAVRRAERQMRLLKNPFPPACPYTPEQILDTQYWPGD